MKDVLYPLRVFHGRLHEWRIEKSIEFSYMRSLLLPIGKKYYVVGTPTHTNIGDSAIVLAEMLFLKKCIGNAALIKELSFQETKAQMDTISRCLRTAKGVVCGHGGGNMGDQWFAEEAFRRKLMNSLPDKPMIVFPQTIYYTPTEKGREEENKSVEFYNNRPGLTLVAREAYSFHKMQELYPDTKVIMTPDIVMSCTMSDFGVVAQERAGVLFCTRSDREKAVSDNVWEELKASVDELGLVSRKTDMYSDVPVTKENRADCVRRKMQEFCGAELVITDRLHGMVFAALTGTPCIVFSNCNHKVKGTYDWISYLPYIRYVETEEEAKNCIQDLLKMYNCQFDNTPLKPFYDQLAEVVKEKCR